MIILFCKISKNTIFTEHLQVTATAWKVSKCGVISGPYFPAFRLNTEIYFVNLRIQSQYRKIRTRSNSVFGHFSRSDFYKMRVRFLTRVNQNYLDKKILSIYETKSECTIIEENTSWKVSIFGVILVRIFPRLDWIWRDTKYSVRMRKNADQNNSEYGHFLCSERKVGYSSFNRNSCQKQYQFNSEKLELVEEAIKLMEQEEINRPLESLGKIKKTKRNEINVSKFLSSLQLIGKRSRDTKQIA